MKTGSWESVNDPARLEALRRSSILDTPADAAFDRIARLATKILHVPVALVSLVSEDRQMFKGCVGLPEPWASARQTALTHSFCKHVVNSSQPLVVADARQHPLLRDNQAIADLNVIAYAGVPLVTTDGFVLGSLCAIDDKPHHWTDDEVGLLHDLAASVMAEIGLLAAARTVQRHEQEQRTVREAIARDAHLLANVRDSVIVTDLSGVVTFWNDGATKLFGFTAEEMIGRPLAERLPEPSRSEVSEWIGRIAAGEADFEGEWLDYRKDGSRVWIEANTRRITDTAGKPLGIMGVSHDISQRKLAEEDVRRAKEAAEAANAAKDKFLAVLSHELRTPLAPVLMSASMMEADPGLPSELLAEVQMIRRNVELEVRLIDDLLDLTRIGHGKLELLTEVVDIHTLLAQTFETCRADLHDKGLRLVPELRAEEHNAEADPVRLQQVFWNVIKNAVKFTPSTGQITVRTSNCEDGMLRIDVIDTGPGIEPDKLVSIFDAFEQGERAVTKQFGGLGLGLSISKALVELHGGTIAAHSEGRGRGATFRISLSTTNRVANPSPPKRRPPDAAEGAQPCLKILLVEDQESTARAMARLLRGMCHEVTSAGTVAGAVERATAEEFDLLICDLGLPDGSGLDVMRRVKSRYPIRGIALTGYGMEDDVRQSRAAGFDHHLLKPITLDKLEGTLREVSGLIEK